MEQPATNRKFSVHAEMHILVCLVQNSLTNNMIATSVFVEFSKHIVHVVLIYYDFRGLATCFETDTLKLIHNSDWFSYADDSAKVLGPVVRSLFSVNGG